MRVSTASDPRLEAMFGAGSFSEESARPEVALRRNRMSSWTIAMIIGAVALLVFVALETRRTTSKPQTGSSAPAFALDPPPPLALPPQYSQQSYAPNPLTQAPSSPMIVTSALQPQVGVGPKSLIGGQSRPLSSEHFTAERPNFPGQQGGAPMVIDASGAPGASIPPPPNINSPPAVGALQAGSSAVTARATRLADPADTIPQGVLIPAVLETAFHSTSAGYARAIVSRDVRGFDGTKVLIPRGSRLIGEYRGNVQPGQNRAVINWTRLIRGDGVTISLNSPATDPLGGGGIRAHVNTHLFERITDTLLQSTIGLAGSLLGASRNTVIVGLPGAAQAATEGQPAANTMRTLNVPAGTSISVFVAQDLEFPDDSSAP